MTLIDVTTLLLLIAGGLFFWPGPSDCCAFPMSILACMP